MRAAGDELVVEGYAAVFNSVTNIGPFMERIAPGAFTDVLNDDVRFLVNHDGVPLARVSSLIDTSAVTYPAYQAATVSARAEERKEND
ncbi:MAG: hypothetical protein EBR05_09585 [Marivivens sp.]|nr:hypothetical protein [Marivivens sp.]